jgi:hypothetical protein
VEELAHVEDSAERVHAFYGLAMAALEARYRAYIETTDNLLDEPSVRIIERVLHDFDRMRRERDLTLNECRHLKPGESSQLKEWKARETAQELVAHGSGVTLARGVAS